MFVKKAALV